MLTEIILKKLFFDFENLFGKKKLTENLTKINFGLWKILTENFWRGKVQGKRGIDHK